MKQENSKNHKIIIIVPTLSGGGAESVVAKLSTILPNPISIIIFYDEIVYNYSGEIISLNEPKTNNSIIKSVKFFNRTFKIRNIKKHLKPDISISFMEYPNLINIFTRKGENIILSVRVSLNNKYLDIYDKILIFMSKFFYNKADHIVAVSKGVAKDLKELGVKSEKIKVIYNPFDITKIHQLAKDNLYEVGIEWNNAIITSGRLTQQKGHWHLIRIFKEVKSQIRDAKLIILGEGELQGYLLELSNDFGFKASTSYQYMDNSIDIFFLGFQKNPFKFISKAKLFALPSLFEGLPNVLIEAMICGVPVLSADCEYGPREILAPDTDFTHETKDVEYAKYGVLLPVLDGIRYSSKDALTREEKIWAQTIVSMLQDENRRSYYKIQGKVRAEDFSCQNIRQQWIDLFNSALYKL